MESSRQWVILVVCGALWLIVCSCASFPCRNLPTIDEVIEPPGGPTGVQAYLKLSFRSDLSTDRSNIIENPSGRLLLSEVVDTVTREAHLFEEYTLDSFKADQMDYTLQIDVLHYAKISRATASILGFISGLSLCTIPVRARDYYQLTATLRDREGISMGEYRFEQCQSTWFHILLLPFFFKTPQKATEAVLANLVRNLYQEISDQGVLETRRTAAAR